MEPAMSIKSILSFAARFAVLFVLFAGFYMAGAGVMAGKLPGVPSEPGLVSDGAGFMIIVAVETVILAALIRTSRWGGWKLALLLSVTYYTVVTVLMQIETWWFLSNITVSTDLLPALFIMRLPVSFVVVPLAVWLLGRGRVLADVSPNPALVMPVRQWVWKAALIAAAYVTLYWCAGYFIAWQNPELRAFYGQPGPALPFWTHTLTTLQTDPGLLPFQILRAMIWMACALPIIRGSRVNAGWTALLVGLMFSLPQNAAHILSNPLVPVASVRLSHLVETASSTFVFGLIVVWLLHRQHRSLRDLFGLQPA
jgi:hypothetical protein